MGTISWDQWLQFAEKKLSAAKFATFKHQHVASDSSGDEVDEQYKYKVHLNDNKNWLPYRKPRDDSSWIKHRQNHNTKQQTVSKIQENIGDHLS